MQSLYNTSLYNTDLDTTWSCSGSQFFTCTIDIGPVKQKIAVNFLSISLNICFGCSKEQSH